MRTLTLNFACGCMWVIYIQEERNALPLLASGLACCAVHEAPSQQIENI